MTRDDEQVAGQHRRLHARLEGSEASRDTTAEAETALEEGDDAFDVNSPFAPARENSPPRRSPLPHPIPCRCQCQPKLARACSRRPWGRLPNPSGDGTQRTSSSLWTAGWRRTGSSGRTRYASEECAARLEVAGPWWGPATGRAMPDQAAPVAADRGRPRPFPRPRPSPLPRPGPSPFPLFSAQPRLLARFLSSHCKHGRHSRANSRLSSHSCAF